MATKAPTREQLKRIVRGEAAGYLKLNNINSVGIGYKIKDGKRTKELSIQFTVDKKVPETALEDLDRARTLLIPKSFTIDGIIVPTDVIERTFTVDYLLIPQAIESERKTVVDPLQPGISIGNVRITAGTLGAFAYDRDSGERVILSNWHVLHGDEGVIGDAIVQPGAHDDNSDLEANRVGRLLRSHLGVAGDCAIASIERRGVEPKVLDLDVVPMQLGDAELDDKVIKSGRTTGVTYGIVRRIEVTSVIFYGDNTGEQEVGGFEIGPDPDQPAANDEISMGGDSGALWMFREKNTGRTTNIAAGLHFAGEGSGNPDEHAMACNIDAVCKKLNITFQAPGTGTGTGTGTGGGTSGGTRPPATSSGPGYDAAFLGVDVPLPSFGPSLYDRVSRVDGRDVLDYTHFSVAMHQQRRIAIYAVVNIDGTQLKRVPRNDNWKLDNRLAPNLQCGNELYSNNNLDRGHLVRRLDPVWGSDDVARKANDDTFRYTNSAPQHANLNQHEWNDLEDYVLDNANAHRLRVSVFTGPVFRDSDAVYRGVMIPQEFWKVVVIVKEDGRLSATAYIQSQLSYMDDLEVFTYGEFRTYQVAVSLAEQLTDLDFGALRDNDPLRNQPQTLRSNVIRSWRDMKF